MLVTILSYVLPFLVLIVTLVTLHEWGHFYAARRQGMTVTHFSIGMGPVLWERSDRHGTMWQIAALPIGGFVRFLGDKDGSSASADAELHDRAAAMPEPERRKHFHLRGPGAKAIVIAAGPAVNIILGLAIISGLYMWNGRPTAPNVVTEVTQGMPAANAGMIAGDRIVSVNSKATHSFPDVYEAIALYPGGKVNVGVARTLPDGSVKAFDFAMVAETAKTKSFGIEQTVGRIGIVSRAPTEFVKLNPFEAVWAGMVDIYKMTKSMMIALGQIIGGSRSVDDIGGPVKMAEMSGAAASLGIGSFLFLVAAISVNLGVMNLFPIPVLDGGQLIVCAIEKITSRPVSPKILGYLHTAGATFLFACMIGLTANDILGILVRTGIWGG